jgi:alpha-mannosidase
VRSIIESAVFALERNPERKFTYVEQAFFQRWWCEQDNTTRATVKKLVASGQLNFVNGGCVFYSATCLPVLLSYHLLTYLATFLPL